MSVPYSCFAFADLTGAAAVSFPRASLAIENPMAKMLELSHSERSGEGRIGSAQQSLPDVACCEENGLSMRRVDTDHHRRFHPFFRDAMGWLRRSPFEP